MRTTGTLVSLLLVGLAGQARAQDPAPSIESSESTSSARPRRMELALSLLPMGLGRFTASPGGMTFTADAAFSYGLGVSASYAIAGGLSLGLAPQAIFNVKPKEQNGDAAQEFDFMARLAYTLRLVNSTAVYAEALPGYSLIRPSNGDTALGPVLGMGIGAVIDLSEQMFCNLGVGYQLGFQKLPAKDNNAEVRTRYLRLAFAVGVRF
jgi:hypothetical protein